MFQPNYYKKEVKVITKQYIKNEQLTIAPIHYTKDKIEVTLYKKTYDISTLRRFLKVLYQHKHNGYPLFGDIECTWKLQQKTTGKIEHAKYKLPLRRHNKKYKITEYWDITTEDEEGKEYIDRVLLHKKTLKVPYMIPVEQHKIFYDTILDLHYTEMPLITNPYTKNKKYNIYVQFLRYDGEILQLSENEELPDNIRERLKKYYLEM